VGALHPAAEDHRAGESDCTVKVAGPFRTTGQGWPSSPVAQTEARENRQSVRPAAQSEAGAAPVDLDLEQEPAVPAGSQVSRETGSLSRTLEAVPEALGQGVSAWLREPSVPVEPSTPADPTGEADVPRDTLAAIESVLHRKEPEPEPAPEPTMTGGSSGPTRPHHEDVGSGWTSWLDVSSNGTEAALTALTVDPLTVDPMVAARRLLGGIESAPTFSEAVLPAQGESAEPTTAFQQPEPGDGAEQGSAVVPSEGMIPGDGVGVVSRETATNETRQPASEPAVAVATFTEGAETRQTAPENREQAIDGSAAMQEVSATGWATEVRASAADSPGSVEDPSISWRPPGHPLSPSTPYGSDEQRRTLVGSLPTVDDSTPLAVEVAEDARRRISLVGKPFPAPPRTRVLTVANQKGGVGKTTSTVNVAAAMAQAGLTVLVLDIDPQGNASTALGIDHHSEVPSLYDVVVEGVPLADVLQPCPDVPNLWCAPATIDLAGAEIELVSMVAREVRLQRALETYLEQRRAQGLPQVDYVFIDCPPSLSLLTINAFVAAQEVFIPIQCEYYALEGLSQLLKHIDLIRGHLNPNLHVSTILLTMYDGRTRLSSQVADEVRNHFSDIVVKTAVPRSVRISEAPSHSQTVMTYDPASSGALSYLEAARELAEQVLTWGVDVAQEEQQ
jgi:chromosome partitioning protein